MFLVMDKFMVNYTKLKTEMKSNVVCMIEICSLTIVNIVRYACMKIHDKTKSFF